MAWTLVMHLFNVLEEWMAQLKCFWLFRFKTELHPLGHCFHIVNLEAERMLCTSGCCF